MQTNTQSICFDFDRVARIGLPEAVFCAGKSEDALASLLKDYGRDVTRPILFTRLEAKIFNAQPEDIRRSYNYDELSRTAFCACLPKKKYGTVAIVSAGTADGVVTWEAARTLEYLGIETKVFEDCGVAGLWRILSRIEEINRADVIIAVAGLDAALVSVLGGLTAKPVFAVPTEVGYGIANKGMTAMSSMLASCSPGIAVLNIGNGYGAACAAARVLNLLEGQRK